MNVVANYLLADVKFFIRLAMIGLPVYNQEQELRFSSKFTQSRP